MESKKRKIYSWIYIIQVRLNRNYFAEKYVIEKLLKHLFNTGTSNCFACVLFVHEDLM